MISNALKHLNLDTTDLCIFYLSVAQLSSTVYVFLCEGYVTYSNFFNTQF